MQPAERLTLAEMREFLSASNNLSFAGTGRQQIYGLVEGVLRAQKYLRSKCSKIKRTASSPSIASATTSTSSTMLNKLRRPSRTMVWSSNRQTRITVTLRQEV